MQRVWVVPLTRVLTRVRSSLLSRHSKRAQQNQFSSLHPSNRIKSRLAGLWCSLGLGRAGLTKLAWFTAWLKRETWLSLTGTWSLATVRALSMPLRMRSGQEINWHQWQSLLPTIGLNVTTFSKNGKMASTQAYTTIRFSKIQSGKTLRGHSTLKLGSQEKLRSE